MTASTYGPPARRGRRQKGGRRGGPGAPSAAEDAFPDPIQDRDHDGEPDRERERDQDREPDPESVARAIVLRQLTNSPKSRHQLAQKLAERNVPDEVAEAVLDRFEDVKLIDDADFAEMWVRSRVQTRKLARGALRRELSEKGIDPDLAEAALEQVSDEQEEEAARELVRRRLRPGTDLSDRTERDKQARRLASMLARKGYAPSMAFRLVGEVLAEAGTLNE